MKRNWKFQMKKFKKVKFICVGSVLDLDRKNYCKIRKRIIEGRKLIGMLNSVLQSRNVINKTKKYI